jgi:hypothetical protein
MLKNLVKLLHNARQKAEGFKSMEADAYNAVMATPEGQHWFNVKQSGLDWKTLAAGLDVSIRAEAVAEFDGKNKKPSPGIGIRVSKPKASLKVNETEEWRLRDWLIEHAPSALTINEGVLQTLTEAGQIPAEIAEIVWSEPVVSATIAKDLSSAVEEE